jgi:hypothetical protein
MRAGDGRGGSAPKARANGERRGEKDKRRADRAAQRGERAKDDEGDEGDEGGASRARRAERAERAEPSDGPPRRSRRGGAEAEAERPAFLSLWSARKPMYSRASLCRAGMVARGF